MLRELSEQLNSRMESILAADSPPREELVVPGIADIEMRLTNVLSCHALREFPGIRLTG